MYYTQQMIDSLRAKNIVSESQQNAGTISPIAVASSNTFRSPMQLDLFTNDSLIGSLGICIIENADDTFMSDKIHSSNLPTLEDGLIVDWPPPIRSEQTNKKKNKKQQKLFNRVGKQTTLSYSSQGTRIPTQSMWQP